MDKSHLNLKLVHENSTTNINERNAFQTKAWELKGWFSIAICLPNLDFGNGDENPKPCGGCSCFLLHLNCFGRDLGRRGWLRYGGRRIRAGRGALLQVRHNCTRGRGRRCSVVLSALLLSLPLGPCPCCIKRHQCHGMTIVLMILCACCHSSFLCAILWSVRVVGV